MRRLFCNAGILAWENEQFHYVKDGYLGVDGDTICYLGETRPEEAYDEEVDMRDRMLIPGLVNGHCHAAMTLLRGVGSGLPLDEWLFQKMIPVEDRMTAEDIAAGNELAMMEMIATGTTSFSDMYMAPRVAVRSNERIGMKMNVCRVVQSFDPDEKPEECTRIRESLLLFDELHGAQNGRVRIDFAIHAEYTITSRIARAYVEACRPYLEKGARMQVHLAETLKETAECAERHDGLSPAEWMEEVGIFDFPTTAAHCVCVTPRDVRIMRRHGVSPVHNPTSNMKLGSGFAPVPQMLEDGLNVCLGTDGAASNNNLNLFEEMHLASILHNGYLRDAQALLPEQVLKMATVNGARMQGRDDTGCLQVGKKADIVAIDLRGKAHLCPNLDPVALLVYSTQGSDVCMTMVDGQMLYREGQFLTLDPAEVIQNAKEAAKRLGVID